MSTIQHTTRVAYIGKHGKPEQFFYKMCGRARCTDIIKLTPAPDHLPGTYVLDSSAVVIYSGSAKRSFCSYRCAGLWCTNESKHGTENN